MDGSIKIWNVQTGQCLHTLTDHKSLVGLLGLSSSYLISAATDATLRIWDLETAELRHVLAAQNVISCFHHDEFKLLGGAAGALRMWNIQDGTEVKDLLTGITSVWQVSFKGPWCVAATSHDSVTTLEVWDFGGDEDHEWISEEEESLNDGDSRDDGYHKQGFGRGKR